MAVTANWKSWLVAFGAALLLGAIILFVKMTAVKHRFDRALLPRVDQRLYDAVDPRPDHSCICGSCAGWPDGSPNGQSVESCVGNAN